jgi:hypothetical protein
VRRRFEAAGRPYLRTPWSWLGWAVILPAAALATPLATVRGALAVLMLWAVAILVGGAVELGVAWRNRGARSGLTTWILRAQANLSLVAVALSAVFVAIDRSWLLPAVWLLLLGHSFVTLGGLTFRPLRRAGWLYQIGGLLALVPWGKPLWMLAIATGFGNLWVAWSLVRLSRTQRSSAVSQSVR